LARASKNNEEHETGGHLMKHEKNHERDEYERIVHRSNITFIVCL